jgi:menaquinol-cytochrome c reductase iron-sulfur subunit
MADVHDTDPMPATATEASSGEPPRRNFLVVAGALAIGAVITIFPFVPGVAVLLDPVLRRKKQSKGEGDAGKFVRVATLESIPTEGAQQLPVIADRHDAWSHFPSERIGAVYLRRVGENAVEAFNAVCPHLGCIYSYVSSRNEFYCPCHNSAFHIDGSRIEGPGRVNPSPRPLDQLDVQVKENGEVWVKFEDYLTGIEEKIPKQ